MNFGRVLLKNDDLTLSDKVFNIAMEKRREVSFIMITASLKVKSVRCEASLSCHDNINCQHRGRRD